VDTYAALCAKYGKDLVPPVHAGDGVQALADNTYLVDFEHLADKNIMATLERSGLLP
jgi:hypothetical protein